ncbi:MAG: hypothetical protein HMLKMBBP_01256 [Planctomycetes bacterium]|nr:hypothetical protein [Planctomycetota bacterium]
MSEITILVSEADLSAETAGVLAADRAGRKVLFGGDAIRRVLEELPRIVEERATRMCPDGFDVESIEFVFGVASGLPGVKFDGTAKVKYVRGRVANAIAK